MRRRDFIAGLGVATKMHEHYRRKVANSPKEPEPTLRRDRTRRQRTSAAATALELGC
jgi:hypothetical protein